VPSDYMVAVMIKEGLLEETKPNSMENFKNLDPRWVDVYWDKGRNYTVPWQWGTTAFTVNTDVYKGDVNTYKLIFDPPPELQGRINMLDDMNVVINAGLRYLNLPRCNKNPEDLKKLTALLMGSKKYWRTFDYATIEKLTSKDVDLQSLEDVLHRVMLAHAGEHDLGPARHLEAGLQRAVDQLRLAVLQPVILGENSLHSVGFLGPV